MTDLKTAIFGVLPTVSESSPLTTCIRTVEKSAQGLLAMGIRFLFMLLLGWLVPVGLWSGFRARRDVRRGRLRPFWCAVSVSCFYAGALTAFMIYYARMEQSANPSTFALIVPLILFCVTGVVSLIVYSVVAAIARPIFQQSNETDLHQPLSDDKPIESGNPYQPPQ